MEKFALNWAEMRSSLKVGRILGKNICDLYTGLFTTNDVKAITLLILNETEFFNFYRPTLPVSSSPPFFLLQAEMNICEEQLWSNRFCFEQEE